MPQLKMKKTKQKTVDYTIQSVMPIEVYWPAEWLIDGLIELLIL